MSLEGIVYPIVTLSLWVSLFIELKRFNIALMTSNSRHDQNKQTFFNFTPMAEHWLSRCWCCCLVLVLLVASGACAGASGCWAAALRAAGLLRALTSIQVQCRTSFLRGIVFWKPPIVFQQKPQKPHCHEMPFLNVDDHNFDPDSCLGKKTRWAVPGLQWQRHTPCRSGRKMLLWYQGILRIVAFQTIFGLEVCNLRSCLGCMFRHLWRENFHNELLLLGKQIPADGWWLELQPKASNQLPRVDGHA